MATRIEKAFALSGDKTSVPTDSTGTEMSFDRGWTSAYELEVGVDAGARDIDRGQHNFLFNTITANIKEWQEQSSPDFNASIAYEVGAQVKYTDDEHYICHTSQAAGTLPTNNSAWINSKFFGSYAFAVSQIANGDASLVGFIYIGQTVDAYEVLIYPEDGRIYERRSVTGTITGAFDPATGTATGLSSALFQFTTANDQDTQLYKQRVSISMSDADYTLTETQKKYGTLELNGTLTQSRDLIVGDIDRVLYVKNNTDYPVKVVCTAAGSGVHVESGETYKLLCESDIVYTSGSDNLVIITSWGEYASGYTETYPNGLDQTDFDVILFTAGDSGDTGRSRVQVPVSRFQIDADPTGWDAVCTYGSADANVTIAGAYASSTSYQLTSQATVGRMKMVTGLLKDGVTY